MQVARRSWVVLLASVAPCVATAAIPVVEDGPDTLTIGGFGRTQLIVQDGDPSVDAVGIAIPMARLMARGSREALGSLEVQVELTRTDSPLLDLVVDLNLGAPIGVKAGQFKVPFAREQLLAIASLPTYDRTWLTRYLAPRRRAGFDAYGHFELGKAYLTVDSALFNPKAGFDLSGEGLLLVERALVGFEFGLEIHAAYLQHAFGDRVNPRTDAVQVPMDKQVDLALYFDRAGLRVLAESMVVLDGPEDSQPVGFYGLVGYLFTTSTYGYEPAIGLDHIAFDDGTEATRLMGNLHWLVADRNLQVSLGYGAEWFTAEAPGQRGLVELQGGF